MKWCVHASSLCINSVLKYLFQKTQNNEWFRYYCTINYKRVLHVMMFGVYIRYITNILEDGAVLCNSHLKNSLM